jgi:hypothetical protein
MVAITRFLVLACLAWLASGAFLAAVEPIPPGEFGVLRSLILPGLGEAAWARFPWRTDIARLRSAVRRWREGRTSSHELQTTGEENRKVSRGSPGQRW